MTLAFVEESGVPQADPGSVLNLSNIISALFANVWRQLLSAFYAIFSGQYAYSFGGDQLDPAGADVIRARSTFASIGYSSSYSIYPNVTESRIRNNINKELIYISTHGSQHALQFVWNSLYIIDRFDLVGYPGRINIEAITLTRPKLVFISACEAAAGTNNVSRAFYTSGAKCVIGWPDEIGEAIDIWEARFFEKIKAGSTINEAAVYADSFDYSTIWPYGNDNEVMARRKIYGNGSQRLRLY